MSVGSENRSGFLRQTRNQFSMMRWNQHGIFGPLELAALVLSSLLFLILFFAYLYFLIPARNEHAVLLADRDRLQKLLRDTSLGTKPEADAQATIAEINKSLQDFEASRLLQQNEGRLMLYSDLNSLMKQNSVRNTSGPTYSAVETTAASGSTGTRSTVGQSIFPAIGITLTVEGQYQNLRKFLRDLEGSRQFIVINSVEFESAAESGRRISTDTDGTHAAPVSLRVDMAAYFRRDVPETSVIPTSGNQ